MRRLGAALALLAVAALVWLLLAGDETRTPAPRSASPIAPPADDALTPPRPRPRGEREPEPAKPPDAAPASETNPGEPAEPTFPFEVTVLRADGTPAAGASVLLMNLDDDGNLAASATADAKGVATLRAPEDAVRVVAWLGAEACATEEFVSPKAQAALTVRLGPGIVVRGRVLRGDAAPEPDADVELSAGPWFKSEFELELRTKSDADGRFAFQPIPLAGIHPLNPPFVEAITADKARGFAEADPARPDAEVVVHLTPGFTVRARFVDAGGKPVVADLWAVGARRFHVENESDGRVALRLVEARYELIGQRSLWDVRVATPSMFRGADGAWIGRALGIHEDGAGDIDLGDVVIPEGKPVRGRVVDTANAPVARARVSLYLGAIEIGEAETDKDGRFEFAEVGDQAHTINVRTRAAEVGTSGDRSAEVPNVRGGDADVRVVLEDMLVIAFKFLSESDRKPLACAQHTIRVKLHGEGFDWYGTDTAGDAMESTAFEVLAPGSYDVEVRVAGYEPMRFESVEVVAGRPTTLDLLLRKKHE